MQVYIALQMNRPGQICPRGNNYCAAVIFAGLLDSIRKRLSIISDAIANGPKITNTQIIFYKVRTFCHFTFRCYLCIRR